MKISFNRLRTYLASPYRKKNFRFILILILIITIPLAVFVALRSTENRQRASQPASGGPTGSLQIFDTSGTVALTDPSGQQRIQAAPNTHTQLLIKRPDDFILAQNPQTPNLKTAFIEKAYATHCAQQTHTISGGIRDQNNQGISGVTVCIDPTASGDCTGRLSSISDNGTYAISGVPSSDGGHTVYLVPSTLPNGFSLTSPNSVLSNTCGNDIVSFTVSGSAANPTLPAGGALGSEIVSNTLRDLATGEEFNFGERQLYINKMYRVKIVIKNPTGGKTWNRDTFKLGYPIEGNSGDSIINTTPITTWGFSNPSSLRRNLSRDIPAGDQETFSFDITTPLDPREYTFYWRMLETGNTWFGTETLNNFNIISAPIPTETPPTAQINNASCAIGSPIFTDSQGNQTTTILQNNRYFVNIVMNNIGDTTWSNPQYNLGFPTTGDKDINTSPNDINNIDDWNMEFPDVSKHRLPMPPGATNVTNSARSFNIYVTPKRAGNLRFLWQMVKDGANGQWFGGGCDSGINVTAAGTASPTTTPAPKNIVKIDIMNVGDTSSTVSIQDRALIQRILQGEKLPWDLTPPVYTLPITQQTSTVEITFWADDGSNKKTTTTVGYAPFVMQFSTEQPNVAPKVGTNLYVTVYGEEKPAGKGPILAVKPPQGAAFNPSEQPQQLSDQCSTGNTCAFKFTVKDSELSQEGDYELWFHFEGETTPRVRQGLHINSGQVTPPTTPNDAECRQIDSPTFYDQPNGTRITTIVQNQRYYVNLTMRNKGTTTWTPGSNYRLGFPTAGDKDVNTPPDAINNGNDWEIESTVPNRLLMRTDTSNTPNNEYTFAGWVTPKQAGNIRFLWQMVQEGETWFGGGCDSGISVTAATGPGTPTVTTNPTCAPYRINGTVESLDSATQTYSPMPNVTVCLDNTTPDCVSGAHATTNGEGEYSINNVQPGSHNVYVLPPTGFSVATPNPISINEFVCPDTGSVFANFTLRQTSTITPTGTGTIVRGDATGDGIVDGSDYVRWYHEKNGVATTKTADFNADGVVDGIDYVIWDNNRTPNPN